ncbi:alcohol dehydrogenase [Actinobacteria bacterium YIM 96077]|uniref:Alcohol dehydrogenase n=1 Tax=Phytoactinopolyspora halophila TaxID=1981511 RepID=A0A329R0Z4_9ACTN|nr:alcohol dehydrogenase catalytic domain-containing protein [Phytoactinopolyspora halophila]AYY11711.1 alcohol dehydrogenase [Actinobacteria bacterium YIM 96077]RAW17856.1 alcohol dehydrogenase [Phytoactinopolyspora halophila]
MDSDDGAASGAMAGTGTDTSAENVGTVLGRVVTLPGEGTSEMSTREYGPPGPGEVRIAVACTALCGSDKRLWHAGSSVVSGHEIAGVIDATGPGVPVNRRGERVIIYIPEFCGHCAACARNLTQRCENAGKLIGWQRDGGFQEYLTVPAANAVSVPDGIALDDAVLALDTLGTTAHGLRMLSRISDTAARERLLVVGCGPLGLGAVIAAPAFGYHDVAAVDPDPVRLAEARRRGATTLSDVAVNSSAAVIEASGTNDGRDLARRAVAPGGSVLLLGEGSADWVVPAVPEFRRKDAFYVRSFYFPLAEMEDTWTLMRERGAALRGLLDHRWPLEGVGQAFEAFCAGTAIKPLIVVRPDLLGEDAS